MTLYKIKPLEFKKANRRKHWLAQHYEIIWNNMRGVYNLCYKGTVAIGNKKNLDIAIEACNEHNRQRLLPYLEEMTNENS